MSSNDVVNAPQDEYKAWFTVQNLLQKKMKINSMSIRKGNLEYTITQKDQKRQHQKCMWFSLVDLFRIVLSHSRHITRCKGYFADLSGQNACFVHIQKLISYLKISWLISCDKDILLDSASLVSFHGCLPASVLSLSILCDTLFSVVNISLKLRPPGVHVNSMSHSQFLDKSRNHSYLLR